MDEDNGEYKPLLCANCFGDTGLRLDAGRQGTEHEGPCPNCKFDGARKLDKEQLIQLANTFFVRGTVVRGDYGGAPVLQFNEFHHGKTDVEFDERLRADALLIGQAAGIGFFYYGPRLWMVGEVEPLKALKRPESRAEVIGRILREYPERRLSVGESVLRVRKSPTNPINPSEYDSPPPDKCGSGRLDSAAFPVLYASRDVDICVHECRVTVEDDLYIGTLALTRELRCLDLTPVLEEDATEFESLDMAVHTLFLAQSHSYDICRAIALAARDAGFDGLIYPSYFSLIHTGARPFDTAYGISLRRFPSYRERAAQLSIPNIAVFGRPVAEGRLMVRCINRLVLRQVTYDMHFGPAGLT